jgi:hypothetical protein
VAPFHLNSEVTEGAEDAEKIRIGPRRLPHRELRALRELTYFRDCHAGKAFVPRYLANVMTLPTEGTADIAENGATIDRLNEVTG